MLFAVNALASGADQHGSCKGVARRKHLPSASYVPPRIAASLEISDTEALAIRFDLKPIRIVLL